MGHDGPQPHVGDEDGAHKLPSDILTSDITVKPVPGAIVCCGVFGLFDHTGIWIDDDLIVELHGTGLVKAVSQARFLNNRSGESMFVACDSKGQPLIVEQSCERSANEVYNYREYELNENNCYRFTWFCITGEDTKVKSFDDFNNAIAKLHGKKVYWDKAL